MIEVKIQHQTEAFINENRDKINQIATDLDIIAKKVPTKEFKEAFEGFSKEIIDFWSMISDAQFICGLDNENWWNFGNWSNLLKNFEETIKEFTDYFKQHFPELF